MADSRKQTVTNSEKSPRLFSENAKEDVILRKRLQLFDRSQQSVVNEITMEQKILWRRFQKRVHRSRLSYAKAMGNLPLAATLRQQTTFLLNTNIGRDDNEADTLQKVWSRDRKPSTDAIQLRHSAKCRGAIPPSRQVKRAQTAPGHQQMAPPLDKNKTSRQRAPQSDFDGPGVENRGPVKSLRTAAVRPDGSFEDDSSFMTQRRPVTAHDISSPALATGRATRALSANVCRQSYKTNSAATLKQEPEVVENPADDVIRNLDLLSRGDTGAAAPPYVDERKANMTGFLRSISNQIAPLAASGGGGRRRGEVQGIGSMFTEQGVRLTLLDVQRFRSKCANLDARLSHYSRKVAPLAADTSTKIADYYSASRLGSGRGQHAQVKATEEDFRRSSGDLTRPSLTIGVIYYGDESGPD